MTNPIPPAVEEALAKLLRDAVAALPRAGATVGPDEIARRHDADHWKRWMEPVREVARRMAERGELEVVRHGKPVEGWPWRGVIRFRATRVSRGETDERPA